MEERTTACRGIRGAITVEGDGAAAVASATVSLLDALVGANGCALDELAAAIFTLPDELRGTNPAAAARAHGWSSVPLLLVKEEAGDLDLRRCLRVLLLWNTTRKQSEVRHIYLGEAATLRPDLIAQGGGPW